MTVTDVAIRPDADLVEAMDDRELFAADVDKFMDAVWAERERRLRAWVADGLSQRQIADEVGRDQSTISRWMTDRGITPKQPKRVQVMQPASPPESDAMADFILAPFRELVSTSTELTVVEEADGEEVDGELVEEYKAGPFKVTVMPTPPRDASLDDKTFTAEQDAAIIERGRHLGNHAGELKWWANQLKRSNPAALNYALNQIGTELQAVNDAVAALDKILSEAA